MEVRSCRQELLGASLNHLIVKDIIDPFFGELDVMDVADCWNPLDT